MMILTMLSPIVRVLFSFICKQHQTYIPMPVILRTTAGLSPDSCTMNEVLMLHDIEKATHDDRLTVLCYSNHNQLEPVIAIKSK